MPVLRTHYEVTSFVKCGVLFEYLKKYSPVKLRFWSTRIISCFTVSWLVGWLVDWLVVWLICCSVCFGLARVVVWFVV